MHGSAPRIMLEETEFTVNVSFAQELGSQTPGWAVLPFKLNDVLFRPRLWA